jgi:hypothetical protein
MTSSSQAIDKQSPKVEFKINLSLDELILALKSLDAEEREFFLENLLAALSPEYLKSIEEARQDYRQGRTVSHEEVFQ